ncbi:MAG: type VI secretion system baseplate subunit TssF [Gemmatimonadales bacterium]|nr:type VI secretion system baseplate subunit TssF [Gemmatimonadales bacterium]MBT7691132.1 type VI secretion system baseplate subunit TssF [Gemmatimonadales bacterium]
MADDAREELLQYYQAELTYLREKGADFADQYPKVANRLELSPDESPDPHVERLLEAFAFLTARVQRNLDQQFPEITTALLELLYPHYLAPVPSMTVVQFKPDPEQGILTTGYEVARHTSMYAEAHGAGGLSARFRTCYPVTLWPVEVSYGGMESTNQYDFLDGRGDVVKVIRIRVEADGVPLKDLELDSLRFHFNRDLKAATDLHELVFANLAGVVVLPEGATHPIELGPDDVQEVGYGEDEAVLPYPRHAHPGYRLLQEYFTFPRKYLFMDVKGLRPALKGNHFDILLLLSRAPETDLMVDTDTFALGCTPAANLFPHTSEPIRLDQKKSEYRLVPDAHREGSTEIHTVVSVSSSEDNSDETRRLHPYYSFDHHAAHEKTEAFWVVRRTGTGRRDMPGTQMMLSLVDLEFDARVPAGDTIYAHTLCTNRRLAEQLPAGAKLTTETGAPVQSIVAMNKPTPQLDPPLGGETRWRLVSHLSLNHLSLKGGPDGLAALKEILLLYAQYDSQSAHRQINGIREMHTRPIVERLGHEAWRGFARGTEVRLVLDPSAFPGSSPFLFASVLRHFIALYASLNSFTRTVAEDSRRPGEVWKQWPALAGTKDFL